MSILEGLRKERGRTSAASAARSRRRDRRPAKSRLSAERIAAALGTPPALPPQPSSTPPKVWVPRRNVGPTASSDTGRHRGTEKHNERWVAPPTTAAGHARHARVQETAAEPLTTGSTRRRPAPVQRPATPVRMVARAVPAATTPDGASGRHRRQAPRKSSILTAPSVLTAPRALAAARAHFRILVVAGVLTLVVTVAMMFGVRVEISRSPAQPQLIATTTNDQVAGPPVKPAAASLVVAPNARTRP